MTLLPRNPYHNWLVIEWLVFHVRKIHIHSSTFSSFIHRCWLGSTLLELACQPSATGICISITTWLPFLKCVFYWWRARLESMMFRSSTHYGGGGSIQIPLNVTVHNTELHDSSWCKHLCTNLNRLNLYRLNETSDGMKIGLGLSTFLHFAFLGLICQFINYHRIVLWHYCNHDFLCDSNILIDFICW